ncbi:Spore coat protein [Ruminococcaceae bacterium BL-6]|jgi:spore coat protein CotF|nr:Spore coat protein [Ruminococcaceae bacterium BL-6]HBC25841.1 spore coat protein [Oscillospiraceae bacterium]HBN81657.1 spore coat protein [Oscillospiraceae bacterium]
MPMQEKEMMEDVLSSQKAITGTYNNFVNECASPEIRNEFLNILNEEHTIQAQVFDEMHKRGWYPTPPAEQQMIDQAKQKYQKTGSQ